MRFNQTRNVCSGLIGHTRKRVALLSDSITEIICDVDDTESDQLHQQLNDLLADVVVVCSQFENSIDQIEKRISQLEAKGVDDD